MTDKVKNQIIQYHEPTKTMEIEWKDGASLHHIKEQNSYISGVLQKLKVKTIITRVTKLEESTPLKNRKYIVAGLNLFRLKGVKELKILCSSESIRKTLAFLLESISREFNILLKVSILVQPGFVISRT